MGLAAPLSEEPRDDEPVAAILSLAGDDGDGLPAQWAETALHLPDFDAVVYEVEAALVGETVTLRFDPSKPGRAVQVWLKGEKIQDAKVVDVHGNCFVKREKPEGLRLADLDKKED